MTARWVVELQIDRKPRLLEHDVVDSDYGALYRLAADDYVREHVQRIGPRPEGVRWIEWPIVLPPTCGWARRRLLEDEIFDEDTRV